MISISKLFKGIKEENETLHIIKYQQASNL